MIRKLAYILIFTLACQLHAQRSDFEAISFEKADKIARSLQGEDLTNLPSLAHKLTYRLETEVEQFRAIYYWVCHNIENDYDLMLKNEHKRKKYKEDQVQLDKWNQEFKKEVFYQLLNNKRTLCTGYAYLLNELTTLAGLESEMIMGYGKTGSIKFEKMKSPNHTWNAVKLDGKWYLSDPTWSSGIVNDVTFEFTFKFKEKYFLMAPEAFAERHLPVDRKWLLVNQEINLSTNISTTSSFK